MEGMLDPIHQDNLLCMRVSLVNEIIRVTSHIIIAYKHVDILLLVR